VAAGAAFSDALASIRISNGSPLVYYDHYTKLHIVASDVTKRYGGESYLEKVKTYAGAGIADEHLGRPKIACGHGAMCRFWYESHAWLSDQQLTVRHSAVTTEATTTITTTTSNSGQGSPLCPHLNNYTLKLK